MQIFCWIIIVLLLVVILACCKKIKSKFEEISYIVSANKNSTDNDILNLSKDINLRVNNINLRLDNEAKAVKKDRLEISKNKKEIEQLKETIVKFEKSIIKIENQINIFSDSENLNSDTLSTSNDSALEFDLDSEQSAAFELMNDTNNNLFITGKAGTGKSYLLKYFVAKSYKKILVLAPTGIAALNVNGVTIHSAFGFNNLKPDIPFEALTEDNIKLNGEKRLLLKNIDTIIIDEISMVRCDIFEKINRILKIINETSLAFGGKQIIIFGDIFQLPPVAEKNVEDFLIDNFGGIYFFNSNAYKQNNFKFVELTINHRQKDDVAFFQILNNVREGKIGKDDLEKLNSRVVLDTSTINRTAIKLFPKKTDVVTCNRIELEKIPEKEYVFNCEIIYSNKITDTISYIESNLPISTKLKIKIGAVIMMISNDINHHWANGTRGIISYIDKDCVKAVINNREYEIQKETFEQDEIVYENGEIKSKKILEVRQYPFVLAYAITIHKSQGMTFPRIACDVSGCFASGQAYVALSRCESINGLFLLNSVNKSDLQINSEVSDFYKSLKEENKANIS